jgi:TRAP-type transport system periplasmic protein
MNIKFNNILMLLLAILMLSPVDLVHAKTLKIATVSPEGTFWMKQMRAGAKEISKKTDGRVKLKFYPGGVMGNDDNVLRKMHIGQLQGGALPIGALSQLVPDTTIYGLPFLFPSLDDAEQIRRKSDQILSEQLDAKGFVNFGFAQGGFTYLMSKEKITSFEDLREQKSWVLEKSDVGHAVYRYIGVTPVSLPLSDVLTGLQTGLINTVVTSPIGALALQWHTHMHYVVDLPLNYLSAMMVIDKKVFSKLSEADQQTVRDVMTNVYKRIDEQNRVDNDAARQALINQGVEFVSLSPEEKAQWKKAGHAVTIEMIKKYDYDEHLYDVVMAHKPDAPKLH